MMPSLSLKQSPNLKDILVDANDAVDRIVAMRQQEISYATTDYLDVTTRASHMSIDDEGRSGCHVASAQSSVDEACRSKMCEWCYQVIDYFKFQRDTVQIAMSYLDRYLARPQGQHCLHDRAVYQLCAITCLYLAIKVHEPMELDMGLLAELSRGSYGVPQIRAMEESIIDALEWKMNPPTAMSFVQNMLSLLPSSVSTETLQALMDVSRYQTELSLCDYTSSVLSKPSVVATAAVMNALEGVPTLSSSTRSTFIRHLGKMTGCTRYMDGVSDCRSFMMLCLQSNPLDGKLSMSPHGSSRHNLVKQKSVGRINMKTDSPVAITTSHR